MEADCVLHEWQLGIGQLLTDSKLFHNNFSPFWWGFPYLQMENFWSQRTSPKNCSFSWLLTISETYNQFHLEMFYVAAQENKKGQILRLKSQVSRLLTNKYNSANLSLKFCFRRGWQRGRGGGGFQSHITFNFLSNHVSRVIFFKTNQASRRKE